MGGDIPDKVELLRDPPKEKLWDGGNIPMPGEGVFTITRKENVGAMETIAKELGIPISVVAEEGDSFSTTKVEGKTHTLKVPEGDVRVHIGKGFKESLGPFWTALNERDDYKL